MPRRGWTEADVPAQTGRTFLVTGANAGLGYETARVLAQRGARVILACRRPAAGEEAAARLQALAPAARVEAVHLDLADLASVASCGARVLDRVEALDCLVNNAGIMAIPPAVTVDGFERQFAVNHLGHFALTGRLLPSLLASPRPRVVTLTSETYRVGRFDPADAVGEHRYRRWRVYAGTKLANLLFALEFDRRARAAGVSLRSLAAHPGLAATGLQVSPERRLPAARRRLWRWTALTLGQTAAAGAWPTLRAATDPEAAGGTLYGPSRLVGGPAVAVTFARRAADDDLARRLWDASERWTGVSYPFPASR